jgi:hypothetical protein
MKKNVKKETRHLVAGADAAITICGRPVGKVLLWAKKGEPGEKDTVCGRCKALKAGRARTEKIVKKHEAIREAGKPKAPRATGKRIPSLQFLGDRMPRVLEVTFKGKTHQAEVIQDEGVAIGAVRGTIRIGTDLFNSPSRAGKHVAGREVDGWTFWSYANKEGGLEKLDALRKAVA